MGRFDALIATGANAFIITVRTPDGQGGLVVAKDGWRRAGARAIIATLLIATLGTGAVSALIWQTETVDAMGDGGGYTSLALDATGNPRIDYFDATDDAPEYAAWNGTGWEIQIVDRTGKVGLYTSLALDAAGNPRISYQDWAQHDLKYSGLERHGLGERDRGRGGARREFHLARAGRCRQPQISYHDYDNAGLRYTAWNGTGWEIETVVDLTGDGITSSYNALYNSLALDAAGNPRICYLDWMQRDLMYTAWNGTGWEIETVDAAGDVGWFSSLALDAGGNPRIGLSRLLELRPEVRGVERHGMGDRDRGRGGVYLPVTPRSRSTTLGTPGSATSITRTTT